MSLERTARLLFVWWVLVCGIAAAQDSLPAAKEWRHFYGICWDNATNADALRYAKQLAHHYIFYKSGMESDANATDMNFFLETPEYACYSSIPVNRYIDTTRTYTAQQMADYQKYFPVVNNNPFPFNMGRGWPTGRSFSVQPDYQQQAVIDYFVTKIIAYAQSKERTDKNFRFAGCAWDVPQLPGDFYYAGNQVTLAVWTGGDSSLTHAGITHEYPTYSDGHAAFYKKLKAEIWKIWPDAKFIVEPYDYMLYWLQDLVNRPDRDTIVKDVFVSSEEWGTRFVVNPVFTALTTKSLISRDYSGSSVPSAGDTEPNCRMIAGNAGKYGAWFNWFGRFNMPANTLANLTQREKLIRVLPNWDNIAGVPLAQRTYSYPDSTYASPNSRADGDVIWSRNPDNRKIFVIFLNANGVLTLGPDEHVLTAQRTSTLLIESGDGMADLTIADSTVRLKTASLQGQCFVLTTDNPPPVGVLPHSAAGQVRGESACGLTVRGRVVEIGLRPGYARGRALICAPDGRVAFRAAIAGEAVRWQAPGPGVYLVTVTGRRTAVNRVITLW